MRQSLRFPFFLVIFGIFTPNVFALKEGPPPEKPRLVFVGHATVLIEGTETTLLTDPFFKPKMLWLKRRVPAAFSPAEIPPLDAVLISHTHPDHFDTDALEKLSPRPVIIMPWGRGKFKIQR